MPPNRFTIIRDDDDDDQDQEEDHEEDSRCEVTNVVANENHGIQQELTKCRQQLREQRASSILKMMHSLPANVIRNEIYPFAIRVFETNHQLRAAVAEYMRIITSGQPFPDGYYPIEHWDVSKVTDFSYVCSDPQFEGDVSKWDVSNGTRFHAMFRYCKSFDADVSNWDVSRAADLSEMFLQCQSFNKDLSRWNVSRATHLRCMFSECESFHADLSRWNVSSATDLSYMFSNCRSFHADLTRWDVSSVRRFNGVIIGCRSLAFHPLMYQRGGIFS